MNDLFKLVSDKGSGFQFNIEKSRVTILDDSVIAKIEERADELGHKVDFNKDRLKQVLSRMRQLAQIEICKIPDAAKNKLPKDFHYSCDGKEQLTFGIWLTETELASAEVREHRLTEALAHIVYDMISVSQREQL